MILALDTTLGTCSVALGDRESGILASEHEARERGHAEAIVPMIEAVLALTGRPRSEISGIACTTGPGSFTGLRVGLAAARGLALGLQVRLAGVPTLEALAASLLFDGKISPGKTASVMAVIDGPRGGFIAQTFAIDSTEMLAIPIGVIEGKSAEEVSKMDLGATQLFVGPAARRFTRLVAGPGLAAIDRQPDAVTVCRYVLAAADDLWQEVISPIYFRPPHAKPAKPPPWMKSGAPSS